MSTPDEPTQLTRKQLRDLRNTAATPIIPDTDEETIDDKTVSAPLARAAEPVELPEPPVADGDVDLGSPALTRREVRQRERLRTASVPVITAEVLAATASEHDGASDEHEGGAEDHEGVTPEDAAAEDVARDDDAPEDVTPEDVTAEDTAPEDIAPEDAAPADVTVQDATPEDVTPEQPDAEAPTDETPDSGSAVEDDRRVVAPGFGAELFAAPPVDVALPASFDQLLARGGTATGSLSIPNALILSQTPESGSLVSPVAATGEVLITGTFSLPDSYGSTGTVPGSADGRDVDAVLVDGELPAASSPTPIAASAAISTIKSAEEIIRPPAPEKGSRLMMVLAITAGVLALALAGVLILAFTTGVFS
jgi:hypothetical protein